MKIIAIGFLFILAINSYSKEMMAVDSYPGRDVWLIHKGKKEPTQLILLLHAYSVTPNFIKTYYPLQKYFKGDYLIAIPQGNKESDGDRYWVANDKCCDFENQGNDDVDYLNKVIKKIKEKYNIEKVHLTGHSNGNFMSYTYACFGDYPIDTVAGFAGLPPSKDFKDCKLKPGIKFLVAHGVKDKRVLYYGGVNHRNIEAFGVEEFVSGLEKKLDCEKLDESHRAHIALFPLGKDTTVYKGKDCKNGTLHFYKFDGGHLPRFNQKYFEILRELISQ